MNYSKTQLINTLTSRYAEVNYQVGDDFYWHPDTKTVFYTDALPSSINSQALLLHETAHAILKHSNYSFDVELIVKELEAWEKAKQLGQELGVAIDENYIQSCLDSYRDWLHKRSTCIECERVSLEIKSHTYKCFNCLSTWQVSVSPICRRKAT